MANSIVMNIVESLKKYRFANEREELLTESFMYLCQEGNKFVSQGLQADKLLLIIIVGARVGMNGNSIFAKRDMIESTFGSIGNLSLIEIKKALSEKRNDDLEMVRLVSSLAVIDPQYFLMYLTFILLFAMNMRTGVIEPEVIRKLCEALGEEVPASANSSTSQSSKAKALSKEYKKEAILSYLEEVGEKMTVDELKDYVPALAGTNSMEVSSLLRELRNEGRVKRTEYRGKAYFEAL